MAGGTAFAQALGILALPFLTRIYTPEEFGVLGVFTALLGITSVIACLRYEIAIPLPVSDKSAVNLMALSLASLAVTTLILTVVALPFSGQISSLMNTPQLSKYLWMLPFAVAVTGSYSVFQYWATRKKAFKRIARTRVEQSVGGVSTQLLLGWSGAGTLGLIAGQIVSNGAGFFGLARRAFQEDRLVFKNICINDMKLVGHEYSRFPKYSTFDSLANIASTQLPILLIASLTFSAEVGYLMLAMRIMQAPMGLVGSAISQVYFPRAVEEQRIGRLDYFTARTIGGLAKIGVGPLVFAGIVAPSVFGLIFGESWQRAGDIVAWMTPWFVLQFLVSPVSMILHVTNRTTSVLILNIFGLSIRLITIYLAFNFGYRQYLIEIFAISSVFYYAVWLYYCVHVSNASFKTIFTQIDFVKITLCWVVLAVILKVLFVNYFSIGV